MNSEKIGDGFGQRHPADPVERTNQHRASEFLPHFGNASLPRLVNFRQLKACGIRFSREHVWRMEAAGKFPKRIYLSPQKVAWFEDEIFAWLADRAAERANRVYRKHE